MCVYVCVCVCMCVYVCVRGESQADVSYLLMVLLDSRAGSTVRALCERECTLPRVLQRVIALLYTAATCTRRYHKFLELLDRLCYTAHARSQLLCLRLHHTAVSPLSPTRFIPHRLLFACRSRVPPYPSTGEGGGQGAGVGGFGGGRDVWAGGRRSRVVVIADEASILASRCVRERGRKRNKWCARGWGGERRKKSAGDC